MMVRFQLIAIDVQYLAFLPVGFDNQQINSTITVEIAAGQRPGIVFGSHNG